MISCARSVFFSILIFIANSLGAQNTCMKGDWYLLTNIPDLVRLQPSFTIGRILNPCPVDSINPKQRFIELTATYIPWGAIISKIELNRTDVMDHVISTRLLYKPVNLRRTYWGPVLSGRYGFYNLSERLEDNNFRTTGNRYYQSASQFGIGLGFQNGKHLYKNKRMSDLYWGIQVSFRYTTKTVHWFDSGTDITVYNPPQYIESFSTVPQVYLGWRFGGVL